MNLRLYPVPRTPDPSFSIFIFEILNKGLSELEENPFINITKTHIKSGEEWALFISSQRTFILDYDSGKAVWNYSYDSVQIFKHKTCPIKHNLNLPNKYIKGGSGLWWNEYKWCSVLNKKDTIIMYSRKNKLVHCEDIN